MSRRRPGERVDISAISVTYRSRTQIAEALQSAVAAAEASGLTIELIIVDNASDDGTADFVAESFPDATLIKNEVNRGFGTANNQAFAAASGTSWLLMNPDARLDEKCIETLVEALRRDPGAAAAGPAIRGAGFGTAQSGGMLPGIRSLVGHFLFVNRLLLPGRGGAWRGFQVVSGRRTAWQPVEWLSGAVLLLRPEAVRGEGGFDERIFLYGEDIDLSARLGEAGWRLALVPAAIAWHGIGGSQAPGSTAWLDGISNFLVRRGTTRWRLALCFLVIGVGLAARAVPWGAGGPNSSLRAHRARMRTGAWRAMGLAAHHLVRGDAP